MFASPLHSSIHSLLSRIDSLYQSWYFSPFRFIEIPTIAAMQRAQQEILWQYFNQHKACLQLGLKVVYQKQIHRLNKWKLTPYRRRTANVPDFVEKQPQHVFITAILAGQRGERALVGSVQNLGSILWYCAHICKLCL